MTILQGSGTTTDPYLLPESIYLKYKDEYPGHAKRIRDKIKAGKVILTRDAAPGVNV